MDHSLLAVLALIAVAIGGVVCGLRLVSCLLLAGFDLSSGLKPGGVWAAADKAKDAVNKLAE